MATAADVSPSRKRQKPAEREEGGATLPARDPELALIDLSEEILIDVSQYLAPPSAAMFAVALTAPSKSWQVNGPNRHEPYEFVYDRRRRPSDISERIISAYEGSEWDTLDFADVYERSVQIQGPKWKEGLSERIADSDLSAILLCIDAPNKLKRLTLVGLVSIEGWGLEPLRGSTVAEQIDLSTVEEGWDPKWAERRPSMREIYVTPILDSIVAAPGSSLKHLQFSQTWYNSHWEPGGERLTSLHQFLPRYSQYLDSRPFACTTCADPVLCKGTAQEPWFRCNTVNETLAQNFTCSRCTRNFCDDFGQQWPCDTCERIYCGDCVPVLDCAGEDCFVSICKGCDDDVRDKECAACDAEFCPDCWYYLSKCICCDDDGRLCENCAGGHDLVEASSDY